MSKLRQKLGKVKQFVTRTLHPPLLYMRFANYQPIHTNFGFNRGKPIDRYYIESFLKQHRGRITGSCLEIKNNTYTKMFGSKVKTSDVLDIEESNPHANIYDDLRTLSKIEDNSYNCVILTQVLQFIDNPKNVASQIFRILAPQGTLLATAPSITRLDGTAGINGDYWRYTIASFRHLFESLFTEEKVEINSVGNLKVCLSSLTGMSAQDLSTSDLKRNDQRYPLLITLKATK